MIHIVTTATQRGTHKALADKLPQVRRISYPLLFLRKSVPAGTYIFTDFDRLTVWQLEIAAHYYRRLAAAGCRVLNDPARALQRLPLLRRLYKQGINTFNAWSAHDIDEVDRFPALIRTAHGHRGALTGALPDAAALAARLDKEVARGYTLSDLIIVEYCAEPVRENLFRKPSVYRIGDRMVQAPSVHQEHWSIRYGSTQLATEQEYIEDLERVRTTQYGPVALRAFEAGSIDYGRADIGVVGGVPQFYEINTNPALPGNIIVHHSPSRIEAFHHANDAYYAAMAALDSPGARGRVTIGVPQTFDPVRLFRLRAGIGWGL